ncbi:MAG: GntR family transcriptional regulator [Terriglobales bacterium]
MLLEKLAAEPFLSGRELARRLGMSNTPIRSAIERLESEGLIVVSPQRGLHVRQLTNREIADHYELRELLEPFVCRRLAGNLKPDQVRRLLANLEELEQSIGEHGVERIVQIDTQFHLMLAEFYSNEEIVRAISKLRDKITQVIVRVFESAPERLIAGCQEHRRIAEAIIDGQPDLAGAFALDDIQAGKGSVLPRGAWT